MGGSLALFGSGLPVSSAKDFQMPLLPSPFPAGALTLSRSGSPAPRIGSLPLLHLLHAAGEQAQVAVVAALGDLAAQDRILDCAAVLVGVRAVGVAAQRHEGA